MLVQGCTEKKGRDLTESYHTRSSRYRLGPLSSYCSPCWCRAVRRKKGRDLTESYDTRSSRYRLGPLPFYCSPWPCRALRREKGRDLTESYDTQYPVIVDLVPYRHIAHCARTGLCIANMRSRGCTWKTRRQVAISVFIS